VGQPYAPANKALGICDRCGWTYRLRELKPEVIDLQATGILVCPTCWDPDQPQLQVGRWPVVDPQALRNPRPDTGAPDSRWGEGGSRGTTVWNFHDDAANWRASKGTTTWNSEANRDEANDLEFEALTIAVTQNETGYLTLDYFENDSGVGEYTSIDSSVFDTVRMEIRLVGTTDDIGDWTGYAGKLFWTTATSGSADPFGASDYETHAAEPEWKKQMGNQHLTMEWDLSSNVNWTGTITGFRIYLYDQSDSDNYKTFSVDSIRVTSN
jgi:hypothetical protein